jgi:hypothetical protein
MTQAEKTNGRHSDIVLAMLSLIVAIVSLWIVHRVQGAYSVHVRLLLLDAGFLHGIG